MFLLRCRRPDQGKYSSWGCWRRTGSPWRGRQWYDELLISSRLCVLKCQLGNPIGGLVFSSAFSGQIEQLHEWTVRADRFIFHGDKLLMDFSHQNFVAADQFCFRACHDAPQAPGLCNHIYDEMGCDWNMPGNYNPGFDSCQADSGPVRFVVQISTYYHTIDVS